MRIITRVDIISTPGIMATPTSTPVLPPSSSELSVRRNTDFSSSCSGRSTCFSNVSASSAFFGEILWICLYYKVLHTPC